MIYYLYYDYLTDIIKSQCEIVRDLFPFSPLHLYNLVLDV